MSTLTLRPRARLTEEHRGLGALLPSSPFDAPTGLLGAIERTLAGNREGHLKTMRRSGCHPDPRIESAVLLLWALTVPGWSVSPGNTSVNLINRDDCGAHVWSVELDGRGRVIGYSNGQDTAYGPDVTRAFLYPEIEDDFSWASVPFECASLFADYEQPQKAGVV